jgi:hypothetical protein
MYQRPFTNLSVGHHLFSLKEITMYNVREYKQFSFYLNELFEKSNSIYPLISFFSNNYWFCVLRQCSDFSFDVLHLFNMNKFG